MCPKENMEFSKYLEREYIAYVAATPPHRLVVCGNVVPFSGARTSSVFKPYEGR
jgi:hypothetical protein